MDTTDIMQWVLIGLLLVNNVLQLKVNGAHTRSVFILGARIGNLENRLISQQAINDEAV